MTLLPIRQQGGVLVNEISSIMLRRLANKPGEPIEEILRRAADQLGSLNDTGTAELRLVGTKGADITSIYSVKIMPGVATVTAKGSAEATLIVVTTAETFRRMVEGSYSPVQAYADGRLRFQGNVELGKQVIRHLAVSDAQLEFGPGDVFLSSGTWHLDGINYGSLTVSGRCFNGGGPVVLVYDYGGGQYQKITAVDANGSFTVTEHNLFCGDIPGRPGVGVIVTATDTSNGQQATKTYATPCG
jgi:hypothetical protein